MFKRITCVDNIMLIGSFGEMEIKETNWECGSAKSSGPDTVTFLDSLKSFGRL